MKTIRFLAIQIIMLLILLAGINAFLGRWGVWGPDPMLQILPASVIESIHSCPLCYWWALVGLVLLYWLSSWAVMRRCGRALNIMTNSGEAIRIHPGALLKFIRQQLAGHPAIVSHALQVRQSGAHGLAIGGTIGFRAIDSLPTIKRQVEELIRQGFSQVMGIEKIDRIDVAWDIDDKDLTPKPARMQPIEPPPEPPLKSETEPSVAPSFDTGAIDLKPGMLGDLEPTDRQDEDEKKDL